MRKIKIIFFQVAFNMDINSIHDEHSAFPTAIRTIMEAMYAQLFRGDFGVRNLMQTMFMTLQNLLSWRLKG